jgi:hypothetical protein
MQTLETWIYIRRLLGILTLSYLLPTYNGLVATMTKYSGLFDGILSEESISANSRPPYGATPESSSASGPKISTSSRPTTTNCNTCKQALNSGVDTQRSTKKYWKNCKRCRDKSTRLRQRAKERRREQTAIGSNNTESHHVPDLGSSPPPATPLDRTCDICSDTFPPSEFPRLPTCAHNPQVCGTCFTGWLTSQVGATSWDRIVCPTQGCTVLVTHAEMKSFAPEDVYTMYPFHNSFKMLATLTTR